MPQPTHDFLHALYARDEPQRDPYINWTRGFAPSDEEHAAYEEQRDRRRYRRHEGGAGRGRGWRFWDRE